MNRLHSLIFRVRPAFAAAALKRLFRVRRAPFRTKWGVFLLDPVSQFGSRMMSAGGYEPQMVEAVQGLLRPGDLFLDVGANEGFFSIIASKRVGPEGRVFAVEPQSRLQPVIVANIARNKARNVELLQRAVSDERGIAELFLPPDTNTGSSGLFRTTRYRNPSERVLQATLSDIVAMMPDRPIRLMKMDIESFEHEAILGSKPLFEEGRIENIALELHPPVIEARGKRCEDITEFLESCGYRPRDGYRTMIYSREWI